MAKSRSRVSDKELLSLFDKSLHDTSSNPKALKSSHEEIKSSPASPPTFTLTSASAHASSIEQVINPLFNLADAAIDAASAEALATQIEETRQQELIALRDSLMQKCREDMQKALAEATHQANIRRIETIPMFEVELINQAQVKVSTSSMFTPAAFTPLQIAAYEGDIKSLKELLNDTDNPTDIDSCAGSGLSPLWLATYAENVEAVKLLVHKGANYNLACVRDNQNHKTPYEIAEHNAKAGSPSATAIIQAINDYDAAFFYDLAQSY